MGGLVSVVINNLKKQRTKLILRDSKVLIKINELRAISRQINSDIDVINNKIIQFNKEN